jgi:hypothetical protein
LMRPLLSQSLTPTGSSQNLSVFSGLSVPRIASLHLITQSTSAQPRFILTEPFDRRRLQS